MAMILRFDLKLRVRVAGTATTLPAPKFNGVPTDLVPQRPESERRR
jgi:hypothetical protein